MRRDRSSDAQTTRVRSRVLFSEQRMGILILDCVLSDDVQLPGRFLCAGSPFAIEVSLPSADWADAAAATIERWVAECRNVVVELRRARGRLQLHLTDGDTSAQLDVLATPGL